MPELGVLAQVLWDRAGLAPTLTVTDDPARWCAVELAATPENLGKTSTAAGATASWASWQRGMVRPGPITVPAAVWAALRSAQRVYYRAHSSSAQDVWIDHQVTVPDRDLANAPSIRPCDVWTSGPKELMEEPVPQVLEAVEGHPDLPSLLAQGPATVLICLHRFSPKRPVDPAQLELVVLLACETARKDEVRMLVLRLNYTSLAPIAARVETLAGALGDAGRAPLASWLASAVGPEAARWPREQQGPFLILRDNSPAPDEVGGTCVLLTSARHCAYCATTKWNGRPEVIVLG